MKIEPVEELDYAELKAITCSCISRMDEIPDADKLRLQKSILENIKVNVGLIDNSFFKASEKGRINGYILIKGHKKLSELFVRPDFQKKNIGSMLLKHALDDSYNKGTDGFVWVNAAINAVPFYQKNGLVDYESEGKKFSFVRQLQYRF